MIPALSVLVDDQALGFVVSAAIICAISGWLLAHLTHRTKGATRNTKPWWLVGMAVVAGAGVWTTHFIAMLGYRTDIALGYDLARTVASAAAAVVAVGIPVALASLFRKLASRAVFGAVAGIGIGAMHVIGMTALKGCSQTQSLTANGLACLVGATFMALACSQPARRSSPAVATILFVLAVCGTHFISLAGTVLDGNPAGEDLSSFQIGLSLLMAGGTAFLLLAAFVALVTARRFEAQEEAHTVALATALENMSNGILKLSACETVQIFNRRLLGMLRLEPQDLTAGMPLADLIANVGRANGWDGRKTSRVLNIHRAWMRSEAETRVEHVFDDGRILAVACQPVADGAVLTYDDVSKVRQAQWEIEHLAYHDPLTGLANRRSLQERLVLGFKEQRRFELLLLDLDRFKFVNDTFGHGVGDRLLQQVAERLRSFSNQHDVFLSRLGGDEMALVSFGETDFARSLADRVIAEVANPYSFDDVTMVIGCSIGMCGTDDAAGPDDLMQQADLALYEAKRTGRGRSVYYRPGLIEAVTDRNRLENDLRVALRAGQFHLVYQPVQSLANEEIVGYEALIRWQHPTRGLVSPVNFIPLAEETGLIVAIGRWVLEEACRQALLWPAHQHVAVNVSAVQFRSPLLLSHVTGALSSSGLPAHRLEIELTETALVEDGRQIAQTLAALRELGIKIAMDDFGTGYSSLAHLRDLPLDRIKIDRSFVSLALDDPHSLAVIRAITQMGRDMGIATLAEGVETADQLELLRSVGCGAVQGYLIGRPESQTIDLSVTPSLTAA